MANQNPEAIQPVDDAEDVGDEFDPMAIAVEIEQCRKEFNGKFKPLKRGASNDDIVNQYNRLIGEIGGTILPLLRDTAYQQAAIADMIPDDPNADEELVTQFLPDDAKMFFELIGYCQEVLPIALQRPDLTDDQRSVLQHLSDTAAACKQCVEDGILTDDDDDEPNTEAESTEDETPETN